MQLEELRQIVLDSEYVVSITQDEQVLASPNPTVYKQRLAKLPSTSLTPPPASNAAVSHTAPRNMHNNVREDRKQKNVLSIQADHDKVKQKRAQREEDARKRDMQKTEEHRRQRQRRAAQAREAAQRRSKLAREDLEIELKAEFSCLSRVAQAQRAELYSILHRLHESITVRNGKQPGHGGRDTGFDVKQLMNSLRYLGLDAFDLGGTGALNQGDLMRAMKAKGAKLELEELTLVVAELSTW